MASEQGHSSAMNSPEPIAIVSAACRLPGHASSPQKLWELLQSGGVAVSNEVPPSRFGTAGHFDGSGRPGTLKALSGMFVEDLDPARFDAPFFKITRADAIAMDPQQRQLLEVVYECFENGGVPVERVSGENVGCFVGSYTVDYQDMQNRAPAQRVPGMTVGIGRAILSNRISHFFNLKGSSMTIDTACSGGLVGVDIACHYLRAGMLSGAIVAAANLWLSPEHTMELGSMRAAYSPTGRCHTFDAKADGYCRAEAVNAVYLKRLSDAMRDGDPIRAVIRGSANNCDGWTPGINSPSSEAQTAVIRAAYADAGIDPSQYVETGFLECHGTGTPAGDPAEVKGASSVLAAARLPSSPLVIGSLKSNVGHSEPGAGISGLIKAMMAVEQGWIPGNPTFVEPNPDIDFEGLHVRATRVGIPWPAAQCNSRRASVNSFGYGGSNCHVVLDNSEHYLRHSKRSWGPRRPHVSSYLKPNDMLALLSSANGRRPRSAVERPQVLVFSANDQESLKRQMERLSSHLLNPRVRVKLHDLSYTLSERRSRHYHRAFVLGRATNKGFVDRIPVESARSAKQSHDTTRLCLVFTGQGAQWPQMGAELVSMFPETAGRMLETLDAVLQELPAGVKPDWSLVRELTEARSPESMSRPELSQPLVTALQLAQLAVLGSWQVAPDVVVGHSSGECAAACGAGILTPQQAILVAYFRGLAAKQAVPAEPMGMLAVGLGPEQVQPYLDAVAHARGEDAAVACFNSPASVTLSGPSALLTRLMETIKADGHFARMLRVELAYHSHHMSDIAHHYEDLLVKYARLGARDTVGKGLRRPRPAHMVSSVTGELLTEAEARDPAYWKANMMSPVQFDRACRAIFRDNTLSTDLFLELGPTHALAAPVAQIAKAAGVASLTYLSASRRGQNSAQALFEAAGHFFLRGAPISLRSVNSDETAPSAGPPAVVVDLPNYSWNHSAQYWHESWASKDWRFRNFPEHELLGSKLLGTLWQSPSWHKVLRLSDVPWLRGHRIGSEILFPAAGYIAMAMEAVLQAVSSTASREDIAALRAGSAEYRLKDIRFLRGLVLQDNMDVNIMLLLYPVANLGQGWWEYKIMTSDESDASSSPTPSLEHWNQNSTGYIRLDLRAECESSIRADQGHARPLQDSAPGKLWYKAMTDAGYSYGPEFQKLLAIECTEGQPSSRSLVSFEAPPSRWEPSSEYAIHPACLDGCIQSVFASLHLGNRSSFEQVLLPSSIDRLAITGSSCQVDEALSVASSDDASSNVSVYEPASGRLIMDLQGLQFAKMNVRDSVYVSHEYACVVWKPDFHNLDTDWKLEQVLSDHVDSAEVHVDELLSMAAHKKPNLRVFEFDITEGRDQTPWLAGDTATRPMREFYYASNDATTVLAAQQQHSASPGTAARKSHFVVLNPLSESFSPPPECSDLDLVVVRWHCRTSTANFRRLASNVGRLLAEGGSIILCKPHPLPGSSQDDAALDGRDLKHALQSENFTQIRQTPGHSIIIAELSRENGVDLDTALSKDVFLVHLATERSQAVSDISSNLRTRGWNLAEFSVHQDSVADLPPNAPVLILDEIAQPVLATASEEQWRAIQALARQERDLLWVTQGSQIQPTEPANAVSHGVFRSVRAEMPMVRVVTLDVESSAVESAEMGSIAIDAVLRKMMAARKSSSAAPLEFELAERRGILHISRVVPDEDVNRRKLEDEAGGLVPGRSASISPEHSHLFVGGLKGICGSLAIHLASKGARHIAILSRGGYEDRISQRVARNIRRLGCSLHLVQGDVTLIEDVRRCFDATPVPTEGITHGAAVLRDRPFEDMSHAEYHAAIACKVQGTMNLHAVSLEKRQPIKFFTMVSSISGVVGQRGQANYAGGNSFQDAFARHRRAAGLPAISIDLGPVDDIGMMQGQHDLQRRFDSGTWFRINEGLVRRIFAYSLLQQQPDPRDRHRPVGQAQMVTGLAIPQPADSDLLRDMRFAALRAAQDGGESSPGRGAGAGGGGGGGGTREDAELAAFFLLAQSAAPDRGAVLLAAVAVVGAQVARQSRLSEAVDPDRPLSHYGMDSLAAVELRNWVRMTLRVELTTLDVVNAASLTRLCAKVLDKMGLAGSSQTEEAAL